MTQSVIFHEQPAANGQCIGVATLNQEKSLNALTLDMVRSLKAQLEEWAGDDRIACVFLDGAGPKAFCAGGDVQALYQSAIEQPGHPCELAEEFFRTEYRTDYLLHTYPKPVICWGDGIVMGGGLGLMAGCSHAVVTEKTRLAMPEITIGLYPDVGGSWFLNKMPGKTGLFLALTGASINARDCLYGGLSSYLILSDQRQAVLSALAEQNWSDDVRENQALVDQLLGDLAPDDNGVIADGNLESHAELITQLCAGGDPYQIIHRIASLETEDAWLAKARDSLKAGSPTSALVIFKQLQLAVGMPLAEVFKSEYQLSTNIVRYPDFAEGVRALLVDKDRNPQWQHQTLQEVPEDLLARLFSPPQAGSTWPVNPLADLGAE